MTKKKTTRRSRAKKPDLSYISEDLRPLAVPITDLVPDPKNARKHSERNLATIVDSLSRFGQQKNVVVFGESAPYTVIAGNGTLQAAGRLGWSHLAVNRFATEAAARAFAIADNRTAELAEWDLDILPEQLAELQDEGLDLDAFGFSEDELEALIASASPEDSSANPPRSSPAASDDKDASPSSHDQSGQLPDAYRVLIECDGEEQQLELLEKLTGEGYDCRALSG